MGVGQETLCNSPLTQFLGVLAPSMFEYAEFSVIVALFSAGEWFVQLLMIANRGSYHCRSILLTPSIASTVFCALSDAWNRNPSTRFRLAKCPSASSRKR